MIKERFGKDELQNMQEFHALPDGWEGLPYGIFLQERRKLMAAITRRGFETLK